MRLVELQQRCLLQLEYGVMQPAPPTHMLLLLLLLLLCVPACRRAAPQGLGQR